MAKTAPTIAAPVLVALTALHPAPWLDVAPDFTLHDVTDGGLFQPELSGQVALADTAGSIAAADALRLGWGDLGLPVALPQRLADLGLTPRRAEAGA